MPGLTFKSLFTQKTDNTLFQLIRYTFVGGVSFLVDYGALYVYTSVFGTGDLSYLVGAFIGFILGLILNYILCNVWVFSKSSIKNKKLEFLIFAIIGVVGLGLTEILMYFFTTMCGIYFMISKPITTALVYIWNFTARKYIIFNKTNDL